MIDKDILALAGVLITAIGGWLALRQKADDAKVDRLEVARALVITDMTRHILRLEKRIDDLEKMNQKLMDRLIEMECDLPE